MTCVTITQIKLWNLSSALEGFHDEMGGSHRVKKKERRMPAFFLKNIYFCIYFWLFWVFVAA